MSKHCFSTLARAGVLASTVVLAACGNVTSTRDTMPSSPSQVAPESTFVPQVIFYVPADTPTSPPTATSVPTAPPASPTSAVPTPLPDEVNPYTGLVVSDTAALNRLPLLIKVANTAEVRPQVGLAQADVVVEHYTEGGITRFSALFLANAPEQVGSVRSCRLIDIELPVIFGSALVCSGTSPGVKPILRSSQYLFDRDSTDPRDGVSMISDFGPYECATCPMFRTTDRPMPHNLFANTLNAWKELDARGRNTRSTFNAWTFSAAPVTAGKVVSDVTIPYTSGVVSWKYDAASGVWSRAIKGYPHTDARTGRALTATNVIVVYAPHEYTSIQEDTNGALSIEIQIWGEGPLKVYRDGRVMDGTWQRDFVPYSFALRDSGGKALALKPGNSWVEIVPLDMRVKD